MKDDQAPILVCKDLCISYYTRAGEIPAVVDFSLTVLPGETHSSTPATSPGAAMTRP